MNKNTAPHTFIAESRELLRDMEEGLLTLEQSPQDTEAVNAVFRAMHTIKGSSGVFGFDVIVDFTHVMEGVVEEIRSGRAQVDEVLVALLLSCGDHVSSLIDCLESDDRMIRLEATRSAGSELLQQLSCYGTPDEAEVAVAAGDDPDPLIDYQPGDPGRVASGGWHISARFSPQVLQHGMDPLSFVRYLSTLGEVRVAALFDAMPEPHAMDPQACYVGLEMQFTGVVQRQDLEDAFEYVRDDSTIRMLPPHAPIADYAALLEALPEEPGRAGQSLIDCGALSVHELEQVLQALATNLPAATPTTASMAAGNAVADGSAGAVPPLPGSERKASEGRYLRVHAGKLDELIDLVGELVIAGAGVNQCTQKSGDSDLREAAAAMSRLVEQVRDGALMLRMVPIGDTFNRFNRVAHDLGRELGKDVELMISGAETELDKSMVEKLGDPLMHLVRNALDHGIETPAQRRLRGKPERGKLQLNAYHETGSVVIEIGDDGAGLDRDRILSRALETGLVQVDHNLSDREIFQLIMEPGFSTAREVTNLSGRGVGMDVVRRNIESLRGSVVIESTPGQGTFISLRLPLTLAIIDGFLVGVGASAFVVPLEMVVECLELPARDHAAVRESSYINLRGEVLPLLRLRDVFETRGDPAKRENVVVVQYAGHQAGFVVDELMGEFQTVIKPLGKLFERLAGISGSTIMGTGEVALILDVPGLVQKVMQAESAPQARASPRNLSEGIAAGPVPKLQGAGK